jgi:dienelactone hydrolase
MFPVWPQTDLPVGQILGRVSCQQDISQSYALYLPSTYDPDSRWPVVFCFDPAAQGVEAVHFYREAAEKYGYVVLGSNNSRNGPLSRIFDAADAMITDARGRLTIDEDRVYFSGFSGGARVAARLGMLAKKTAGVIACGAGFPTDVDPEEVPFPFLGLIGTGDMNFLELHDLEEQLAKRKIVNRLLVFDGGHSWPPSVEAVRALEWMELQASRAGLKEVSQEFLASIYYARFKEISQKETTGRETTAYLDAVALQEDLNSLYPLNELAIAIARLSEAGEVREGLKSRKKIEKEERRQLSRLKSRLEEALAGQGKSPEWWAKHVEILRTRHGNSVGGFKQMWARVLDFTWRNAVEHSWFSRDRMAVELARIAVTVEPDRSEVHYTLARALAAEGKLVESLNSVKKAVELGLSKPETLEQEPVFSRLLVMPEYRRLLTLLRAKQN